MIRHYLKIAFRNLIKYKTQTIISIIGLSVGFTCFALSTFWIHYEMTYDAFLKGSERTYILYKESVLENSGFDTSSPYPLSTYLKRDFPENRSSVCFDEMAKCRNLSGRTVTFGRY